MNLNKINDVKIIDENLKFSNIIVTSDLSIL